MNEFRKEEWKVRIGNLFDEAKVKVKNGIYWCQDHKEFVTVFGPVAIGSAIEIVKIVVKKGNLREERRLKDLYIYDRSAGHYQELRRKPKQSEWIKIDELKRQGVPLSIILQDLKLLK